MQTAVSFDVRRYARAAETHSHPHHQIVLPIRGRLDMTFGARCDHVCDGQAAVIPAGQPHSFAGSPDNAFLIADFASQRAPWQGNHEALWEATGAGRFVALDHPLRGLCAFLAGETDAARLRGLRALFAGDLLLSALERGLGLPSEPVEPALLEARAFMQRSLQEPLSVEQVARRVGLSASRFHALFRDRFGVSPMRYLASCRLTRAARLLEQGRLPIAEVALAVGYSDQSAFTRAFRRTFGTAPAQYRIDRLRQEDRHRVQ